MTFECAFSLLSSEFFSPHVKSEEQMSKAVG